MKKMNHFLSVLFLLSITMISCEKLQEIESFKTDVTATDINDSGPTYFRLDIEGGDYSVGIIDRLVSPERVTIVTKDMCPFIYYYAIPEGVTPKDEDIEVIATNSSMPHIMGFRDEYGSYAHTQTYHYAVFWNGSIDITALFEENWRAGSKLPKGADDGEYGSGSAAKMVKVDISMQRIGHVFTLKANYTDHNKNLQATDIFMFTTLNVLAGSTLTIEAWSNSEYGGELIFDVNGSEQKMKFRGFGYERLDFSTPNDADYMKIFIK